MEVSLARHNPGSLSRRDLRALLVGASKTDLHPGPGPRLPGTRPIARRRHRPRPFGLRGERRNRPGAPALKTLLLDAKRGFIDIVFAEALDRISRDQEHIHGIHKRLLYWKVRLYTLYEGEIQSIHISIGGYMNSAFIENLKAKTKRGQIGAVHAGRIPGGLSYGYRIANRVDDQAGTARPTCLRAPSRSP